MANINNRLNCTFLSSLLVWNWTCWELLGITRENLTLPTLLPITAETLRNTLMDVAYPSTFIYLAMVGPDDILGLLPSGRHTVTTNGPARHHLATLAGAPFLSLQVSSRPRAPARHCRRRSPRPWCRTSPRTRRRWRDHLGSCWSWHQRGRFLNVRTVGSAVLEPSEKEEVVV